MNRRNLLVCFASALLVVACTGDEFLPFEPGYTGGAAGEAGTAGAGTGGAGAAGKAAGAAGSAAKADVCADITCGTNQHCESVNNKPKCLNNTAGAAGAAGQAGSSGASGSGGAGQAGSSGEAGSSGTSASGGSSGSSGSSGSAGADIGGSSGAGGSAAGSGAAGEGGAGSAGSDAGSSGSSGSSGAGTGGAAGSSGASGSGGAGQAGAAGDVCQGISCGDSQHCEDVGGIATCIDDPGTGGAAGSSGASGSGGAGQAGAAGAQAGAAGEAGSAGAAGSPPDPCAGVQIGTACGDAEKPTCFKCGGLTCGCDGIFHNHNTLANTACPGGQPPNACNLGHLFDPVMHLLRSRVLCFWLALAVFIEFWYVPATSFEDFNHPPATNYGTVGFFDPFAP